MNVLIIGAGGFVGRALTAHILRQPGMVGRLTLVDQVEFDVPASQLPVAQVLGDFSDPHFCRSVAAGADAVVLLAAVLGGAAEARYELSRRINVDATLSLFEALRNASRPPRVVFASTIGVYGHPLPARVEDSTVPHPDMVYGAQKLMMEVALSHFSRRGWLDGLALRLPGIMARPGADGRLKSAFLNNLFYAVRDGRDIELPVPAAGTTWLMSVRKIAANLAHALHLPAPAKEAGRAVSLPCLCPSIAELVAALARRYPRSRAHVSYAPDAAVTALFASYPPMSSDAAARLGFTADANLDELVRDSMTNEDTDL